MNQTIQLDNYLNADLHCHSLYSDGVCTPSELAKRAKDNGVQLWALTDHDEIAGVDEARVAAQALGLPFLSGVEITVTYAVQEIHIVALGIDVKHEHLRLGLEQIRKIRYDRARLMAGAFDKLGIKGTWEGALEFASNPQLISRTHFARFLVESGICKDNAQAFKKYLGDGKPCYVRSNWISLKECLHWIREANGIAVIAHPGRYKRLSKNQHRQLFTEFCTLGGQGVEVVTGSHSPDDFIKYTELARELGLWASRGSDYHSAQESRIDLGRLPLLPASLDPIWKYLEKRILY